MWGSKLIGHMSAQMSSLFNKASELNCHYCQQLTAVLPARWHSLTHHSGWTLSDDSRRIWVAKLEEAPCSPDGLSWKALFASLWAVNPSDVFPEPPSSACVFFAERKAGS